MIDFLFFLDFFVVTLCFQLFGAGLLIAFYRWNLTEEIVWLTDKRRKQDYISGLDVLKEGFNISPK